MRILLAHNYYQQPGGEDKVFAAEAALLEQKGQEVVRYCEHNVRIGEFSRVGMALRTLWNHASFQRIRDILRKSKPSVCHFHNTFPLISPAVFYAARAENIPVVVTLHNYRMLCPGATLMREGQVCEECQNSGTPWPAVRHKCYRGSRTASATVGGMLVAHRLAGTWSRLVDCYVALSEFAKGKFVDGGFPSDKLVVKPNFVEPDPGYAVERGGHALFAGRLSPEKGIETLLEAWRLLRSPIRLRIAGDGPLANQVREAAAVDDRIEWLGAVSGEEVIREMKQASLLVFPSVWYEGQPLAIIEAYATGLPVLASELGAMLDLVHPDRTGLHFKAGDPRDLARRLEECWAQPARLRDLGRGARREYEQRYTADGNYGRLMDIYRFAGATA